MRNPIDRRRDMVDQHLMPTGVVGKLGSNRVAEVRLVPQMKTNSPGARPAVTSAELPAFGIPTGARPSEDRCA
jgi:hypothetical protein